MELEEKQRQFEQVKAQILGPRCAYSVCTHCDPSERVSRCFLLNSALGHWCPMHAYPVVGQGVFRVWCGSLSLSYGDGAPVHAPPGL